MKILGFNIPTIEEKKLAEENMQLKSAEKRTAEEIKHLKSTVEIQSLVYKIQYSMSELNSNDKKQSRLIEPIIYEYVFWLMVILWIIIAIYRYYKSNQTL